MSHHEAGREIGPDGTITLFKDLLRQLGDRYDRTLHIGAPETQDNGDILCKATFFTATNRYTLHAVQAAEGRRSELFCVRATRLALAVPFPTPPGWPSENLHDSTSNELTAESFNRLIAAIVRSELVVLETAKTSDGFREPDVTDAETLTKDDIDTLERRLR